MSSLALLVLAACDGGKSSDSGLSVALGPEMSHAAPSGAVAGEPLLLTVSAVDPDGVSAVNVYHRLHGASDWSAAPMVAEGGDAYTVTLDGSDIADPSVEYYFKATDSTSVSAYLPSGSSADPYVLDVSVVGLPLPFAEDFEVPDGETELSQIGWGSSSTNFRGYPWQFSAAQARSGGSSAFHPRGYAGTDGLRDYLVSPALDLSGVADAQVSWWEYGSAVEEARHALFVSVGSRDPADGDYVKVGDLPAPLSGAWGRSAVYDLSAYAGQPTVYVAWYFEGVDADDWWVDDVRVEARQADLSFDWAVSPAPIQPGDAGVLTVTVTNASEIAATDARVTVTFPEGGVSLDAASVTLGAVDANGTASADFVVTVDADVVTNQYLPVDLGVTWGSASLARSDRFLVGVASVAHLDWTAGAEGVLDVSLGVGDPAAPTWETEVYSGAVKPGTYRYDVDITDQSAALPPAPGANRWFVRGVTESAGALGSFTIEHDGLLYAATVLPVASPETEFFAWLPEPPLLLVTATTTPAELDPGTVGASLTFTVANSGAATAGPVEVTVISGDSDLAVTDPGPLALGTLAGGARVGVTGGAFDVAVTHVDSSPVDLVVELTDGVETWTYPLSFAVPFPVLRITGITVDDDGRDGILDSDESADITFDVTNVGDETTSGTVSGALSVESSSTASASASTDAESFGTFTPGTTRDSRDFTVDVVGGSPGDTVDLLLTLTDSARSYAARTTLTLGEPPWQSLSSSDDDIGDALASSDFDLVTGRYRVVDGILQIQLVSDSIFDPSRLFIEAWGTSSGADWLYYRLVLQSGAVDLQGYDSSVGFLPINEPTVSFPDAYTVQFDLVTSEMGLFLGELAIGFGGGWCGPPEYYCDQYPNSWGYPYDSFTTANWFSLTW